MSAYKKFFDGGLQFEGPEDEAMISVKKDLSSAAESEYWASWSVDKKVEIFELILKRNNVSKINNISLFIKIKKLFFNSMAFLEICNYFRKFNPLLC